jgi:hypothetical protein
MTQLDAEAEHHFLNLAFQYYASGRTAAASSLLPVAGNLLHHGVEMLLKALLVRDFGLEELKGHGHRLEPLWAKCIAKHPELHSASRSDAIRNLHRFEFLRYPDSMVTDGFAILVGWTKSEPQTAKLTVPYYELVMEGIDDLFSSVFSATGKDPKFYTVMFAEAAVAALRDRNLHALV